MRSHTLSRARIRRFNQGSKVMNLRHAMVGKGSRTGNRRGVVLVLAGLRRTWWRRRWAWRRRRPRRRPWRGPSWRRLPRRYTAIMAVASYGGGYGGIGYWPYFGGYGSSYSGYYGGAYPGYTYSSGYASPPVTYTTPTPSQPYLTDQTYEPGDGYRYPLYYNPATGAYFYYPVAR